MFTFSAFKSRKAFIQAIEAPQQDVAATEDRQWSNIDLDPSPIPDRKWSKWVFLAFWLSHASNSGAWTSGSSSVSLGLSPLSAWLSLATAHLLITALIVINGRGPARYHIGFPVMARSSYGMWGSYMAITMRAIVCIIWNGTNSYYGARLVTVAITAIWPSYKNLPNTLPESAGITSVNLASFFIFMFVFCGMCCFHSRDLKYFYMVKSVLVFIAMHGVLIWWMKNAKGVKFNEFPETSMSQSAKAWLVLKTFNAGLGSASSLTVNQGDMARYATKPNDQLWTTLIGYPLASALPCLYGILVAAASRKIIGTPYWNLWDTLDYMLDQYPESENRGARFGVFLVASTFALAYIGVNLATNSLPFGSDLTAMFPRWFTIRRGQFLCAVLGICIVPWKILVSAQAFITFLSGYGYWLAPIASILMVDYYFIQRGNIDLKQLYTSDPTGRYWYTKGWNYRAVAVTICALVPCLPGFASSISAVPLNVSQDGKNLFNISFVLTYVLACLMYYVLHKIFPVASHLKIDEPFEALADANDQLEAEGGNIFDRQTMMSHKETASSSLDEKDSKDGIEVATYALPA